MTRTIAKGGHPAALAAALGIALTSLTASCPIALAQDRPNTVENGGAPAPMPVPTSQTPQALVGKSIQDLSRGRLDAAVKDDVKALRRGPLLIHGNYCGLGGRPGTAPIDALDAACMRHDACTTTGKLPNCACDDRLRLEATVIAQDPHTRPDVQAIALATASAMAVLICKDTPASPPGPAATPSPEPSGAVAPDY